MPTRYKKKLAKDAKLYYNDLARAGNGADPAKKDFLMKKQKEVSTTAPVLFTLNDKARAMAELEIGGPTLQTPEKGLGKAWRLAGYTAANTRVAALAAVLAICGDEFTAPDAESALAAAKKEGLNLGTGSPRSYVAAFIKNGYFAQA